MPSPKPFHLALASSAVALGLATVVHAQTTTSPDAPARPTGASKAVAGKLDASDRQFIEKAAAGGMAEVETGQLAQQKAGNDAVKQFGARMVQDHGKANDELKQLAGSKGVPLPSGPDKMHTQQLQKFQKASGAEFDREYMQHMLADHKKDVAEFQKQAQSAKDPDVKAFAAKTLPTLQEHLKQAQSVNDSIKNRNGTKTGSKSG